MMIDREIWDFKLSKCYNLISYFEKNIVLLMKIFQSYNVLPLTAIDTPVSATKHIKIKEANISISSDDVALTFDSWLWKFNQLGLLSLVICVTNLKAIHLVHFELSHLNHLYQKQINGNSVKIHQNSTFMNFDNLFRPSSNLWIILLTLFLVIRCPKRVHNSHQFAKASTCLWKDLCTETKCHFVEQLLTCFEVINGIYWEYLSRSLQLAMGQGKYTPIIATMGPMWSYVVLFYLIVPSQQPLNILCLDIIPMG